MERIAKKTMFEWYIDLLNYVDNPPSTFPFERMEPFVERGKEVGATNTIHLLMGHAKIKTLFIEAKGQVKDHISFSYIIDGAEVKRINFRVHEVMGWEAYRTPEVYLNTCNFRDTGEFLRAEFVTIYQDYAKKFCS